MHPTKPVLLLLPLFFCTCGPAPQEDTPDNYATEWLLTEGKPLAYYSSDGNYKGFRLRLAADSARLHHPITGISEKYRAYPATAGSPPDSVYLTYALSADSTLDVRIHAGGEVHAHTYRPTPPLGAHPLTARVMDETYRFELGSQPYLLTFTTVPVGKEEEGRVARLHPLDTAFARRIQENRDNFGGLVRQDGTVGLYAAYRDPVYGTGGPVSLLVSTDATGELQLHRNLRATPEDPAPVRIVPQVYPGQLPPGYDPSELADLLNRGRISVRNLTAEPDSFRIQYAYPEDFERRGGITTEELDRLDFEFAADGSFHAFAGDRLITEGEWSISPDRNFIQLPGNETGRDRPILIQHYDGESMVFLLPLKVQTRMPRGEQLLSYYDAQVMLQFEKAGSR
ncbi:hypothetical protein [Lewinella sp. IMCC34183]|uniref:hypothetical protein n=1 Tax=Lewinella sp. IMCC34183 TaxID=2248762 RepID=UPI000E233551|nr:hypothetical protein [Lewinella sp. IMCC34183]